MLALIVLIWWLAGNLRADELLDDNMFLLADQIIGLVWVLNVIWVIWLLGRLEGWRDRWTIRIVLSLALLGSLGVRIVLVHGARPQIERQLTTLKIKSEFADNMRITLNENMPAVEQAVGQVRMSIEAQLSMGLPNTPMAGLTIRGRPMVSGWTWVTPGCSATARTS